jgi:Zn-dependent protease
MFRSYRLGTAFGIPIRVNVSFLLLLGLVLLWMGGLQGLFVVLLAFSSVVVHELGHALVARRLGVRISEIELHFFGGAAKMIDMPRSPGHEIAIAAAGPAVSLALAGVGYGLAGLLGVEVFALIGAVNAVLGLFNLLPAFPSDGGRILRALLARKRGLVSATQLAVKIGRVVLVALALGALYVGAYQLLVVVAALWMMGTAERLAVHLRGEPEGWRGAGAPAQPVVEYIPAPSRARPGRGPSRPVVFIWRA